jgi:hypothetical protein
VKTCECQAVSGDDAVYCASCGRRMAVTDDADTPPSQVESSELITANPVQQKRILVIIASFIAIALVVATGLTYLLRNVHIEISANNLVSVQLPLDICTTSVGVSSDTPANLPATVQVDIAKGFSTQLAFYSDNEGVIEVLAPSGWTCTAVIGADGSSSVTVSPAGQSDVSSGALTPGSTAEEINASQTSACVGCRESLACPLFVNAANDYLHAFQKACPSRRPTSELVTKINGHVVEIEDPPGVNGDADPSGGAYPAVGVMTYFGDGNSDGSWTETCVLPPTDTSLCKAIIGNFSSRYGSH